MNLKRAFRALWEEEPVSDTGIPESEQLEAEEPVSQEKLKSVFIPLITRTPAEEIIEQSHDNH